MIEVEYDCGCKAAGDNVSAHCLLHGNPIVERTSLECRYMDACADLKAMTDAAKVVCEWAYGPAKVKMPVAVCDAFLDIKNAIEAQNG